ncbi:MAG: hypothetical protein QME96_13335, partial [Myxococcota bacterium]|nr:hypothetical protein [Myxococcota bacterium]
SGAAWDSPEIGRSVPRGSSFNDGAWRGLHGRDARANLASCVSCHSARDCTTCHSTGPSPHGSGFGARCSALADLSPGVCLPCHSTVPECR